VGVEWGLQLVEPETGSVPGAAFNPHPFEPLELDLILVGSEQGPVQELLASAPAECDHDSPDLEWMSHHCPPTIISPAAVLRCATQLSGLSRATYASPEVVLNLPIHYLSPGDEQWFYDALAQCADAFHDFISGAARGGYAVRFSVSG